MDTIKRASPSVALCLFALLVVHTFAAEAPATAYKFTPDGGQYVQSPADLSAGDAGAALPSDGYRVKRLTKRGVPVEGYADDTVTSSLATMHTPADTKTVAAITSSTARRLEVKGRATLYLSGHFVTASESCVARIIYAFSSDAAPSVIRYEKGPRITLTASTDWPDEAGLYMSDYTPFDALGAKYVYVAIETAPTTGNVSLNISGP